MAFVTLESTRAKAIKVRITLTEEALGMQAANPEINREFLAAKAPDAKSTEEEIEAIGLDEVVEKSMTIFPKDKDGNPFWWDYQMKGALKDVYTGKREVKGTISQKSMAWNGAKIIDHLITVSPRKIMIGFPKGGEMGECQRPLRAKTMKGDRISLAHSETVPAGCVFEFELGYDEMKAKKAKKGAEPAEDTSTSTQAWLMELLTGLGERGVGQWRNSGKGRCVVEIDEG